jgi:hypothetical protein
MGLNNNSGMLIWAAADGSSPQSSFPSGGLNLAGPVSSAESGGHRAPLLKFGRTALLFCKRVTERESEFAVIERLDPKSPLAQAKGVWQLQTASNDARLLLQEFMEGERRTAQIYAQDIVGMSREAVAENFPDRDLGRVIKAISQRCSKKISCGEKIVPVPARKRSETVRV